MHWRGQLTTSSESGYICCTSSTHCWSSFLLIGPGLFDFDDYATTALLFFIVIIQWCYVPNVSAMCKIMMPYENKTNKSNLCQTVQSVEVCLYCDCDLLELIWLYSGA